MGTFRTTSKFAATQSLLNLRMKAVALLASFFLASAIRKQLHEGTTDLVDEEVVADEPLADESVLGEPLVEFESNLSAYLELPDEVLIEKMGRRSTATSEEWNNFQRLNELRARGHRCVNGNNPGETTNFPANRVRLEFDCRLWRASYLHSQDMADRNYFSHTTQGSGLSFGERARRQGTTANGENIAAGTRTTTGQQALDQWTNSYGHCLNQMRVSFLVMATGFGSNRNSRFTNYWTQNFATRRTSTINDRTCYPR